jgi:thiamine-monophosphate kinase
MTQILQDIGERELIRSILPKYCNAVGDDCAILPLGDMDLLMTTDPVPQPAARVIGKDPDLYWMGWLLVIINASDLAAAGARPLAFLAAIEAPAELAKWDFERLLLGVSEGCDAEGLIYAGGNLREAKELAATGTAVGKCRPGYALRRTGAQPGDVIVSVGQGGIFWRDAFNILGGETLTDRSASPVFRPRSQVAAMHTLAESGLVNASIDNSDGLLPSLSQLASLSGCDIVLDLERLTVPDCPDKYVAANADSARLWLGWGDWNVIASISEVNLSSACRSVSEAGGVIAEIGKVVSSGTGRVLVSRNGMIQDAPRLESERFAKDSWFSGGISSYVKLLREVPLP